MNKLTGMLLLTFTLPLTAAAAPPAAVMMRPPPGRCDDAAQDINRQNTFIITGAKYYGPVK